jgi:hypothetical protein
MDLVETGWGGADWIGLAQDRYRWRALLKAVMNFRVPYNAGKLSSDCTTGGYSSGVQFHRLLVSWSVGLSVGQPVSQSVRI